MAQNLKEKSTIGYRVWLYAFFSLIAIVMLSDFIIPGKIYNQEITSVESEWQRYFNAGGNSHMSYKVTTDDHEFSVTEDLADSAEQGTKIEYAVSRIFQEVNWYQVRSNRSEIYSLRIFTGLVIPLLVLAAIAITYFFKRRMETLMFVLQLLLVLDLIYLIM